jgi:hypothetical protein
VVAGNLIFQLGQVDKLIGLSAQLVGYHWWIALANG